MLVDAELASNTLVTHFTGADDVFGEVVPGAWDWILLHAFSLIGYMRLFYNHQSQTLLGILQKID